MSSDFTGPYHMRIDAELTLDLPEDDQILPLYRLILLNADHLRPWMDWADKVTFSQQLEITRIWREKPISRGFERVLYLNEEPIGCCGIRVLDSDCAEIGYWLSEEHTGRGYITRAVRYLIHCGFLHYGLHRVEIHCAKENTKSRAVPERLHFTHEASLRERHKLPSGYHNLEIYGLLRTEWEAHNERYFNSGTMDQRNR